MEAQVARTTILTLEMDRASQEHFDRLRRQHYPAKLNVIAAHLTLFHTLPPHDEIAAVVANAAGRTGFTMRVTGLRSLGRGVAFTFQSPELLALHADLSTAFAPHLTAQDRQKFQPHVVVQNKVKPEQSRVLLHRLQQGLVPFDVTATGLTIWNYLGGPWGRVGSTNFR